MHRSPVVPVHMKLPPKLPPVYSFQSPLKTGEVEALRGEYVRNDEWNEHPFYERIAGPVGDPEYLALWYHLDVPGLHGPDGLFGRQESWVITTASMEDIRAFSVDPSGHNGPPSSGWTSPDLVQWFCCLRPGPDGERLAPKSMPQPKPPAGKPPAALLAKKASAEPTAAEKPAAAAKASAMKRERAPPPQEKRAEKPAAKWHPPPPPPPVKLVTRTDIDYDASEVTSGTESEESAGPEPKPMKRKKQKRGGWLDKSQRLAEAVPLLLLLSLVVLLPLLIASHRTVIFYYYSLVYYY